jgi:hypothetical protein
VVDDLERVLEGVAPAGGTVLRDPFEVAGVGRMAMVRDAGGAVSGWIVPAPGG